MAVAAAVLGLGLGIAYGFAGTMSVLGIGNRQRGAGRAARAGSP